MRRTWWRLGACGAALLTMAGCWWPASGGDADRTAHNGMENQISPGNVAGLAERWHAFNFNYGLTGNFEMGDPVVSSAGVHAASGCELTTYAPATGAVRWSHEAFDHGVCAVLVSRPLRSITTAAVVADDRVLHGFGTSFSPSGVGGSGFTFTSDAATGGPAGPEHGLLLHSLRGSDAAFATFATLAGRPAYLGVGSVDDPTQVRSFVVDSEPTGVDAITLGVDALFQAGAGPLATTPGDGTRGTAVRAYSRAEARPGCGPVPAGGTILVECPLWVTPVDGVAATAPVIGSGGTRLYVGTDAGTLYALDAASGAVVWAAPMGAAVLAPPALANGTLYVPTGDGRVVAVDAATGTTAWEAVAPTTAALREQPAVAGGLVFTGAADGWVRAFDAAGCGAPTCAPLWSDQTNPFDETTGPPITGAPAVSRGQLYVGTSAGVIVAYGLNP